MARTPPPSRLAPAAARSGNDWPAYRPAQTEESEKAEQDLAEPTRDCPVRCFGAARRPVPVRGRLGFEPSRAPDGYCCSPAPAREAPHCDPCHASAADHLSKRG